MEERRQGYAEFASRIGALENQAKNNAANIRELKDDVKHLIGVLNQAKGGWKFSLALATMAGALGGLAVKMWPFIPK